MDIDPEHETYHQRFIFLVRLEILNHFIELSPFLLAHYQILILKLPSKRIEFKLLMPPKYFKLIEFL